MRVLAQKAPQGSAPGAPAPESDASLMRRIGAGEGDAARAIVARHIDRVVGLSHRMLGDAAEAEDVAQDAFLRLWRNAARWEPRALLGTWLHRVTYNLCVDRLRRRRSVPLDEAAEIADPAPGAGAVIHLKDVSAAVSRALDALPDRQRQAILLVHYQEVGNIEAARILGVSVEAIESLLARGRRSLKQTLAARRPDLLGD